MVKVSSKFSCKEDILVKIPAEARFLQSFDTELPVFLHEEFLAPEICDALYNRLRSTGSAGRVGVSTPGEAERFTVKEEFRKTDFFRLSADDLALYQNAFEKIRPAIDAFFKVKTGKSEGVQALGYSPGCKYTLHADDGDPTFDDKGQWTGWKITMGWRVISTILFITDSAARVTAPNQCTGGHVTFDYLLDERSDPLRIVPKKGLFVAFPSTPIFSHQVHEVTEGYRISLVEWYPADLKLA